MANDQMRLLTIVLAAAADGFKDQTPYPGDPAYSLQMKISNALECAIAKAAELSEADDTAIEAEYDHALRLEDGGR